MSEVQGKRVLVVGLARTGRAAARVLAQKGARVTVTDSRPPASFANELKELTSLKIGLELGVHREATFLNQDLIVVSPGVPWDLAPLAAAREKSIPIVPEIEVASWYLEGQLVGITGSNGKTTTTTLLGKMLEASGLPNFVGGNIGVPLISAVEEARHGSLLVAELSSFQLEAIQSFRPHVAVLLNLTANHLDRHHSFETYVGAKSRIFHNQTPEDLAILNADDPNVMSLAPAIVSRKIFFSRRQNLPNGVFSSNGHILYRVGNLERVLLEKSDVRLRGEFNVEDVLAACAAACVVGCDFDAVRRSVREFKGVEHRLEFVREIHRVEFYNDSKATSVDATAKALTAFDHGVHLILGGKDKGAPYTPLRELVKQRAREILVIGAAAGKIAADLDGTVQIVRAGDLETAVRLAFKLPQPGDVVLLAPACASYDQFQDFEQRGRVFKELVERLAAETAVADSVKQVEIVTPEPAAPDEINAVPPEQAAAERVQHETFKSVDDAVAVESGAAEKSEAQEKHETAPVAEGIVPSATATSNNEAGLDEGRLETAAPSLSSPEPETKPAKAIPMASVLPALATAAPANAPSTPSPELIYVFEVAAQEVAPMVAELSGDSGVEDEEQVVFEGLAEPETAADEPLPFEVPASAAAGVSERRPVVRPEKIRPPSASSQNQPSLFEDDDSPEEKLGT